MALLLMQAFDTDSQAAIAAEGCRRGQASPNGASAAHVSSGLKITAAPYREAKRNGKALQLPSFADALQKE